MALEGFLDNWMPGGVAARQAFKRDVLLLLKAERERCADQADEKVRYSLPGSKDYDLGWKRSAEAVARNIRALEDRT